MKQEHLQKIRQLTFDRRPSAILKAWSTPRDEALEDSRKQVPRQCRTVNRPPWPGERRRRACVDCRWSPGRPDMSPTAGRRANANPNPFDLELKGFQYDVTRGDWPAVKVFLAKLPQGGR